MKRLLRLTGLFFGVVLMGLTGGVLMQRRGSSAPEVVMVATRPPHQARLQLTLVMRRDGHEAWHSVGGTYDGLDALSVSPDGTWLYLRTVRQGTQHPDITIRRVHLAGFYTEPLHTNIIVSNTVFWTPDGAWMVYESVDAAGNETLFRATPDGQTVQNLTPNFGGYVVAEPAYPPVLSPDNDWVAFNGFRSQNEVYVADTVTGQVRQITDGSYPAYVRGHIRNASGDWLIVSLVDGAYRMRLDGTELTRLLPKGEIITDIIALWPEARLMLIQRDQNEDILYALSMDDFAVQWTMPNVLLASSQPDQSYRLIVQERLYQVFPDGTTGDRMEFLPNASSFHFSADGTTVYFVQLGPRTATSIMTGLLHSVRFDDGQQFQTVHTSNYSLDFANWSSDAGWFLITTDDNPGQGIWRIWEATGRRELLASRRPFDHFLGVGRLANPAFNGLALLGGGGLLVAGMVVGMRVSAKL